MCFSLNTVVYWEHKSQIVYQTWGGRPGNASSFKFVFRRWWRGHRIGTRGIWVRIRHTACSSIRCAGREEAQIGRSYSTVRQLQVNLVHQLQWPGWRPFWEVAAEENPRQEAAWGKQDHWLSMMRCQCCKKPNPVDSMLNTHRTKLISWLWH